MQSLHLPQMDYHNETRVPLSSMTNCFVCQTNFVILEASIGRQYQASRQPHPYHIIQNDLIEQMKAVYKTISQEDSQAPQQKLKVIRDFLLKAFEKIKKKDQYMTNLCSFKTKCIKQFVIQMKMWLNNWQLKQKYLVNLRRELAADSCAFLNKIQEIHRTINAQSELAQQINEIKDIICKIEVNYTIGDSSIDTDLDMFSPIVKLFMGMNKREQVRIADNQFSCFFHLQDVILAQLNSFCY